LNVLDSVTSFLRRNRSKTTFILILCGILSLLLATQLNPQKDGGWKESLYGVGSALVAAGLVAILTMESDIAQLIAPVAAMKMGDTCRELGIREFFQDRSQMGDEFWSKLIEQAKDKYTVLGVASHRYISTAANRSTFSELLRSAVTRGVDVTFYFLDPTSEYARLRNSEESRNTTREIVEAVEWLFGMKNELPAKGKAKLKLYTYVDLPTIGITRADNMFVIAHYLARELNAVAPGMILQGDESRPLLKKYGQNLTEISSSATELTSDPTQGWRNTLEPQW
jgi:hypothetical protein